MGVQLKTDSRSFLLWQTLVAKCPVLLQTASLNQHLDALWLVLPQRKYLV